MNCNQCGAANDEASKYCSKCGNKLLKIISCAKCGNPLNPDSNYCVECGAKQGSPVNQNSDGASEQGLINCAACNKEISMVAINCPGCGEPNNWSHPKIKQFFSAINQISLPEKVKFYSNKTEIWAETLEDKLPPESWLGLIVLFIVTLFLMMAHPGLIVGPIAYYYYVMKPKRMTKKSFRANLQSGTWESSDDSFWEPVRAYIGTL
jgi:hypothetical protein